MHTYLFFQIIYMDPPNPLTSNMLNTTKMFLLGRGLSHFWRYHIPHMYMSYVFHVFYVYIYIHVYIYIIIYTFVEPVFLHLPLMFLSLPRQHGLELSLVQEAEGSEENEERVCCSRGTLLRGRMGYIGILILRAIQAGWKDPIKCRFLMICK